jgi:ABC-2 type transport system ATP-binding protein
MPAIEIEGLTKRYRDVPVVDGLTFNVEKGEIFGILGPNGAGKTTTVESIAGLRRPDSGTIRVLDLDPQEDRPELRRRLGVQLQESRLPDRIRVGEALHLYSSFYENPIEWEELLGQLGLEDKRDARFATLSGGQKQRLSVALALVGNPEIVILDELTTGLDPQARRDAWAVVERLKDRGVTVVLVTHFMEEAERLADRLALIDAGKLIALDTPAGLIAASGGEHVISFRPSRNIDESALRQLADVTGVARHGDQIVVTGTGNVLNSITTALSEADVTAQELRMQQATLDDAFLTLTGRFLHTDTQEV